MSKIKSPPDKKRASLAHDRRNSYGESPHAARKAIPRRKATQHQQERLAANQTLRRVFGATDPDVQVSLEGQVQARARLKRVRGFKKKPDEPLRDVIDRKRVRRARQLLRRRDRDRSVRGVERI